MSGVLRGVAVGLAVLLCGLVVCRMVGASMIRDIRAKPESARLFMLTSPAFRDGGDIPVQYTGLGLNVSPPLSWSAPPPGTKSLALVAVDEGTPIGLPLTHWLVFNIPVSLSGLDEGIPHQERLTTGAAQGWNWSRRHGYVGPEPPWSRHLYSFTLYALDTELDLKPAITRLALMRAMKDHVLETARLVGYYSRK